MKSHLSNYKKITVDTNKFIHVFDNLFTCDQQTEFFNFIVSSKFVFAGASSNDRFRIKSNGKPYLQSFYDIVDLEEMNFLQSIKSDVVLGLLNDLKIIRTYVYCSDHTTQHFYHTDPCNHTLMYYPNLEWDTSYGGETMFASDQLTDIVYTSAYVPGRLIIFDSKIQHKMSAPSSSCPFHRFSFVINWIN